MRKNNKGFTLVELLAVIVIMGILMMVAIPSVTRTIENSRKDTFVDIAKSYGNAARTLWTSDNLTCNGVVSSAVDDGDYYILINSKEGAKESLPVLVDQGGKSSWGNRDVNGYVRVNISTTPGVDDDGDGVFEKEPKRVTKFYVALSDGTHGLVDDDTSTMDELVRGNVNMTLSDSDLKKVELTVDDGRLDCAIDANGAYLCTAVTPIKDITGVCVDDQTNVGVTGNVENVDVINYGARYILTYKHPGLDPSTTVPDEMIFFADKSVKFVTAGVIQDLPANSVQMEGNRILTDDDSELVYVSNDKKSITFTDGYTNTLLITWTLEGELPEVSTPIYFGKTYNGLYLETVPTEEWVIWGYTFYEDGHVDISVNGQGGFQIPAGSITYSDGKIYQNGTHTHNISADKKTLTVVESGDTLKLDVDTIDPIYFGQKYSATINEEDGSTFVATYVVNEDGSMTYFVNGNILENFPAGYVEFCNLAIYMNGKVAAIISEDRTEITMIENVTGLNSTFKLED